MVSLTLFIMSTGFLIWGGLFIYRAFEDGQDEFEAVAVTDPAEIQALRGNREAQVAPVEKNIEREDQADNYKQNHDRLIQENQRLSDQLKELSAEYLIRNEKHATTVRQLEESLKDYEKRNALIINEHEQLKSELGIKNQKLHEMDEKKASYDELNQKYDNTLAILTKTSNELDQLKSTYQQDISSANEKIMQLEERLNQRSAEKRDSQQELSGKMNHIIAQELTSLKYEYETLKTVQKTYQDKEQKLTYELAKSRSQIIGLEKICGDYKRILDGDILKV